MNTPKTLTYTKHDQISSCSLLLSEQKKLHEYFEKKSERKKINKQNYTIRIQLMLRVQKERMI